MCEIVGEVCTNLKLISEREKNLFDWAISFLRSASVYMIFSVDTGVEKAEIVGISIPSSSDRMNCFGDSGIIDDWEDDAAMSDWINSGDVGGGDIADGVDEQFRGGVGGGDDSLKVVECWWDGEEGAVGAGEDDKSDGIMENETRRKMSKNWKQ